MNDDHHLDRVVRFNVSKKGSNVPSEEVPTPKFDAKILKFPPRSLAKIHQKIHQKHSRRNFRRLMAEGFWGDVPVLQEVVEQEPDSDEDGGFLELI